MRVAEIEQLYAYNRWANARTLSAAAALSGDHLNRDLGAGHRSVFGTLAHTAWAEWLWLGRWRSAPPAGPSPLASGDLAALRERWAEVETDQRAFLARLDEGELTRCITYENPPGSPWTYSLQAMLQHVVNHSTYHRGQVAAFLRQLGAEPAATDLLVFFDELPSDGEASLPAT
jgi:uncharacterized damage-inducible protein DinB